MAWIQGPGGLDPGSQGLQEALDRALGTLQALWAWTTPGPLDLDAIQHLPRIVSARS